MSFVAALAAVTPWAAAQDEPAKVADARVASLLEEAAAGYTVDEDGDFRLVYDVGEGRSQLVWIPSGTSKFGPLEIRQVWSIAYQSAGPLPADLANRLLDANGSVVLGAWLIQPGDANVGVIFAAQIPAATDRISMLSTIHAVAITADALEKELTGQDAF